MNFEEDFEGLGDGTPRPYGGTREGVNSLELEGVVGSVGGEPLENRSWRQLEAVNKDLSSQLLFNHETPEAKLHCSLPYHLQGDKQFDSPRTVQKRWGLMEDEGIMESIARFWNTFEGETKGVGRKAEKYVSKDEYKSVHVKMNKALRRDVKFDEDEAFKLADEDFTSDAARCTYDDMIGEDQYRRSLFILADVWTPTVDRETYIAFLNKLFIRITEVKKDEEDNTDYKTPDDDVETLDEERNYKPLEDIVPFEDDENENPDVEEDDGNDILQSLHQEQDLDKNDITIENDNSSASCSQETAAKQMGELDRSVKSNDVGGDIGGVNLIRSDCKGKAPSRTKRTERSPREDVKEQTSASVTVSKRKSKSKGLSSMSRRRRPRQKRENNFIDKRYANRKSAKTQTAFQYYASALDDLGKGNLSDEEAKSCLLKVIRYLFDQGKLSKSEREKFTQNVKQGDRGDARPWGPNYQSMVRFMQGIISEQLRILEEDSNQDKMGNRKYDDSVSQARRSMRMDCLA